MFLGHCFEKTQLKISFVKDISLKLGIQHFMGYYIFNICNVSLTIELKNLKVPYIQFVFHNLYYNLFSAYFVCFETMPGYKEIHLS